MFFDNHRSVILPDLSFCCKETKSCKASFLFGEEERKREGGRKEKEREKGRGRRRKGRGIERERR